MTAFQLKKVSKHFHLGHQQISVLKEVDLSIPLGQFVSIMGPSGSGKSTLMHLLGCLEGPSGGEMSVCDEDVLALDDDALARLRCRRLGFVFQSFHLLPAYDALANVALPMAYAGITDRLERARQLLTDLGLAHRLNHRPIELSGGEKQRVAMARALANDPLILLADEPTGALDQQNGRMILDLIDQQHAAGKTIVLVTHDAQVAARAERLIEIIDGRIRSDRRLRS